MGYNQTKIKYLNALEKSSEINSFSLPFGLGEKELISTTLS
jgi:hypothetical protein